MTPATRVLLALEACATGCGVWLLGEAHHRHTIVGWTEAACALLLIVLGAALGWRRHRVLLTLRGSL